jgi:hypothetical protein
MKKAFPDFIKHILTCLKEVGPQPNKRVTSIYELARHQQSRALTEEVFYCSSVASVTVKSVS